MIEALTGVESTLLGSGALGAWVIYFIYEKYKYHKERMEFEKDMKKVVENNTVVMTKVYEALKRQGN